MNEHNEARALVERMKNTVKYGTTNDVAATIYEAVAAITALLAENERLEAERDAAWNDAIEAAARAQEYAFRKGVNPEKHSDHIRNLKKGATT